MFKGSPRKKGICAYCGKHEHVTADHIPPKAIFALPRPDNLITVPACEPCHKPWSKDDEYFRERMCLNDQSHGHPDVNGNLPAIISSLARPQAKGMKGRLMTDSHDVDLVTPSGIYLGRGMAFDVDLKRICRVVERIVRGLYFRDVGQCLPKDHDVLVVTNEHLRDQGADYVQECTKTVIEPLARITPKIIGQNTFSYRFTVVEPASVWGLVFYNAIQFLAITGPKKE